MKQKHHRVHKHKPEEGQQPTKFWEQITAGHLIAKGEQSQYIDGSSYGLMIYDIATRWRDLYPSEHQTRDDVVLPLS